MLPSAAKQSGCIGLRPEVVRWCLQCIPLWLFFYNEAAMKFALFRAYEQESCQT